MARTLARAPTTQLSQERSKENISMRRLLFVLLLSGSSLLAQNSTPMTADQNNSNDSNGQITVQGCVDRGRGDYILIKQDPGMTYELQAKGKTRLGRYLGQQVEVTGTKSPSLPTSSDSLTNAGAPAPVTLTVISIKTIAKECTSYEVPRQ